MSVATPGASQGPSFAETQSPPRRVLWNWSLAAAAVLLIFLTWQCGSGLAQGRRLANLAVRHFHQELNGDQYEAICQEADETFASEEKHNELVKVLTAVHAKLGDAVEETLVGINVNATTNGTFISSHYKTTFIRGTVVETFTWMKKNGTLKLRGYHIESNAFLN
jgi:hypothetical protein